MKTLIEFFSYKVLLISNLTPCYGFNRYSNINIENEIIKCGTQINVSEKLRDILLKALRRYLNIKTLFAYQIT